MLKLAAMKKMSINSYFAITITKNVIATKKDFKSVLFFSEFLKYKTKVQCGCLLFRGVFVLTN